MTSLGARLRARPRVALVLVGLALVAVAVPHAVAAPVDRAFGRSIDRLAAYEGQATCDPAEKPGVAAFRAMVQAAYPSVTTRGISRACDVGGRSEHKEGRAWDWPLRADDPAQAARAQEFLDWLLASDQHGNQFARARRLGVMYIIWNHRVWSSYRADSGWQPYSGSNPHTDHIHFSFSWEGALGRTSWWHSSGRPVCGPPPSSSSSVTGTALGGFVPVTPTRLLDTRDGTGLGGLGCRLGDSGRVDLQVLGRAGVPTTGVTAVALNVTGTEHSQSGWVAAFPTGTAHGGTSSLNLTPGADRAGAVVVPVGSGGRVTLLNQNYSADLVVDITGYFTTSSSASAFSPLAPARLLDTREQRAPLNHRQPRLVPVAGRGGVPSSGAHAVVVNITVTESSAPGHVIAYPGDAPVPVASSVNVAAGDTVPNRAVLPLSASGDLALQFVGGDAHVVLDVVGWLGAGAVDRYAAVRPARVLDTRVSLGTTGPLTNDSTRTVQVAGRGGVPSTGVRAVVMTLTSTETTAPTHVTAWAGGAPRPGTSDLNPQPWRNDANLVVVPVGDDGTVQLFNRHGSVHLVADVLGWFGPG